MFSFPSIAVKRIVLLGNLESGCLTKLLDQATYDPPYIMGTTWQSRLGLPNHAGLAS